MNQVEVKNELVNPKQGKGIILRFILSSMVGIFMFFVACYN
ncbi:hypothetical protein bcere0022_24380 [Bacillus cereus Rock3-44]|nr:hypothetical protein bcere0022_24380 [Bacillus cereus Rock3-44]